MSNYISGLVWKNSITAIDKLVLLALADCANNEGTNVFPSISYLMEKCSLSRRQICYSLDRLVTLGVISKELRVRENGSFTSNSYQIIVQKVEELAGVVVQHMHYPSAPHALGSAPHAPHINTTITKSSSKEELLYDRNDFLLDKFEEFWKLYPNKKAKPQCLKWYIKNCTKDKELPDKIIDGVKKYLPVWKTRDIQFVPFPHTWLNRGSWEDEIHEDEVHLF